MRNRGFSNPNRRMNSALHSIGSSGGDANRASVGGMGDITDDYVGDFATTFDVPSIGYTPLGVGSEWQNITEGQTTQDATIQAALLAPDPQVRAAALNDAVAQGKIAVAATLPNSAFTAADLGKYIKVGAAVYQTMALKNAAGQMQYQPVQVNAQSRISPMMLLLIGLGALVALS